jgi:putative transposase
VISELSGRWSVLSLCDEMSVNRSGYYKWVHRHIHPSDKAKKKAGDIALFLAYHSKHPSHGYRWLNAKIRLDLGVVVSDEYARRCCRYLGIAAECHHYRYRKPGEPRRTYPNMVLASLDVDGPYQVVVSDMTAFWAAGRYWELTLYMDLWNDEIVGWSLSSRKGDVSTYFEGLAEFLANKKEKYMGLETIFHTDQGSVYSSKAYNDILQPYGITRSMSRPGTPTDNGAMEAINGWAKTEMFIDFSVGAGGDVPASVKGYITYFNEERPMCCLGYLTPKQYRLEYEKSHVASITDSTCLRLPTVVSTYR